MDATLNTFAAVFVLVIGPVAIIVLAVWALNGQWKARR